VVELTPPFVEEVLPNSPAARAGLRPDDLIVYIDGQQVPSVKAVQDLLDRSPAGTELTLEIRRFDKGEGANDKLISVRVKLEQPLAQPQSKKP
jgi:serine protease Do